MTKVKQHSQIERVGVTKVQLLFQEFGFIFREQTKDDYGIDAEVELTENGLACGKLIALQIKSGEGYLKEKTDSHIVFRGEGKHLSYWLLHSLPVMLVIYDPASDVAYWQIINRYTVELTGKAWKTRIPLQQKIDISSIARIKEFANKITSLIEYTVTNLHDASHAMAKRYKATILLNRELSKPEIALLVKKITDEVKQRNYYCNDFLKQHFNKKPADVVWLYFALSLEDVKRCNWICITEWIDENLAIEARPNKLTGEVSCDGIVIQWNDSYKETCNFHETYRLSKEVFLEQMIKILSPTPDIVLKIITIINDLVQQKITDEYYKTAMRNLEPELTALDEETRRMGLAPVECRDLCQSFLSLMAHVNNMVLPFSDRGLKTWDDSQRNLLLNNAIGYYVEEYRRFQFELDKVLR